MSTLVELPPLPIIGRSEAYYGILVHEADKHGDHIAHDAAKVGQYVTMALNPSARWSDKLKYFQHALKRHCNPPIHASPMVVRFYTQLRDLIRTHAGQQALRIVSREDDVYQSRLRNGHRMIDIAADAREFFYHFIPEGHQPDWFGEDDYREICIMRNHWTSAQQGMVAV